MFTIVLPVILVVQTTMFFTFDSEQLKDKDFMASAKRVNNIGMIFTAGVLVYVLYLWVYLSVIIRHHYASFVFL